jgi:hypothetical protein
MAKIKQTTKKETTTKPTVEDGLNENITETPIEDQQEVAVSDEPVTVTEENIETSEVSDSDKVREVNNNSSDETPTEESVPTVVEEDNSFAAFAGPITTEERSLCALIQQYIDIAYKQVSHANDAENKLALLIKILFFPYSSSVADPTAMFNIIRIFFTRERKTCLGESYVSQKAHLMPEKQFKEFINIYTTFVALIDARANKVLFRINTNTLLATLGTKYQSFVNWLTIESEKINKLVVNS